MHDASGARLLGVFSGVGVRVDFCSGQVYRVFFDSRGVLFADAGVVVVVFVYSVQYSVCFHSGMCLRLL
ncbi:hypothetical protein BO99DRAFT_249732 [Aspergillus violaceofuscus CBS 115571]|uniref:Uncharacterized protein n=1 Tax=Aspergillus violaceofuscus (strain CBS 115571) TaxID=1450538 RepID=A0A2V5H3M8_ASPV1|nr:hypothetical protein BO99DRAFT_249732 [Aspergillus violaceofuscus CBS 115571]